MAIGRPKGPDLEKLYKILNELKKHDHGIWIRELARRTGLKKSTVSLYLKEHVPNEIEVVHPSKLIKIVKLKHKHIVEGISYIS